MDKTEAELTVKRVGRVDPKKHLAEMSEQLMGSSVMMSLGTMLDTVLFD